MLTNSTILVTGGTGSFGNTFVPMTLAKYKPFECIKNIVKGTMYFFICSIMCSK